MKILILGSNGMRGPYVERVLQEDHQLLLTDVGKTYDGPNDCLLYTSPSPPD